MSDLTPEQRAESLPFPVFSAYCGLHGRHGCACAPEIRRKARVYTEKLVAMVIREAEEAARKRALLEAIQIALSVRSSSRTHEGQAVNDTSDRIGEKLEDLLDPKCFECMDSGLVPDGLPDNGPAPCPKCVDNIGRGEPTSWDAGAPVCDP